MEKKVYFAGSIRGGREDATVYKRIIDYINRTDTVLTEHIGLGSLSVKARTKEDDVHIYERVHIFYDKRKANISAMLNGNAYFKVYPYENEAEIYPVLDKILGNK